MDIRLQPPANKTWPDVAWLVLMHPRLWVAVLAFVFVWKCWLPSSMKHAVSSAAESSASANERTVSK